MPESKQAPQVYRAINAVQKHLAKHGIGKNQTNSYDKYNFRGIDDVYNVLGPVLAEHELNILPRINFREETERPSKNGGMMLHVTVDAEFDFVSAADGSVHTVRTFGEAMDRGDKATNKAMSAAFKYAAFEAFCIPTQGNNDADAESPEVAEHYPNDKFKKNFPAWSKAIQGGKLTVNDCIAKAESVAPLTPEQREKIEALRAEEPQGE